MNSTPRFSQAVASLVLFLGISILTGCSSSEERAQAHYERGLELVEQGDLVKAGLEFRNAVKLKPDHVDALYAFGEIQEKQGDIQAAFRVFTAVKERDLKHQPARLKLAYLLMTGNQLDEAKTLLDQAAEIDPENPEYLIARATYDLRSGDLDKAEQLGKRALEKDPDSTEALIVLASTRMAAKDPQGALDYIIQAPESGEKNIGLQILHLSALEALDDQDGIEKLFGKLVTLFPDAPQFPQAWSRWYMSKGQTQEAEGVIRQFAANNLDNNDAQFALVAFVNQQRGPDAAQSELERMIKAREDTDLDAFPLQSALTRLLFQSDHKDDAISLMRSIVDSRSDRDQKNRARIILATMLGQTDEVAQAEAVIEEVLKDDAKNVEALRLRASIKISRNENAQAVDDILLALNESPEDARLRTMLASAYERDGSSVLAEEQYAKAMTLDKNSPETGLPMAQFLLRHGKADQAERVLEAVRSENPTNGRVIALLAQQKLAQKDWASAQELSSILRQIKDVDKTGTANGEVADKISAAALSGLQKYSESLKLLEKSTAEAGDDQELLPDLIRAYVQAGRQDAAISHLKTLLQNDPKNTLAHVLLGSVYLSQNLVEEAQGAFEEAAADKDSVVGDTSLAQFHIALNQTDQAEKAIRAGLEKDGNDTTLRLLLTSVLQHQERFDEAIQEYEAMFAEDPESTIVANDLASLLSERRGDPASLERAFEIAQRFRTSQVPQYLDTLGWIYYLRSEYSSALPLLRTASQELDKMGLAQFHYGMTLAALGQKTQAITALEKALDLKTVMTDKDIQQANMKLDELKSKNEVTEAN